MYTRRIACLLFAFSSFGSLMSLIRTFMLMQHVRHRAAFARDSKTFYRSILAENYA